MKLRVKRKGWSVGLVGLLLGCIGILGIVEGVRGDLIEAQRVLREQGIYDGPISGVADEATTQAIRRYQIRAGLPLTGVLDMETAGMLLGEGAGAVEMPPAVVEEDRRFLLGDGVGEGAVVPGDFSDLRIMEVEPEQSAPVVSGRSQPAGGVLDDFFVGGPYAGVGTAMQRQVVRDAQSVLRQEGYYRGPIDGIVGSGTREALRAWQQNTGLPVSGRLDGVTLARMGLAGNDPGAVVVKNPVPATEVLPDGRRIYEGIPVGGVVGGPVVVYGGRPVVVRAGPAFRPRVGIWFGGRNVRGGVVIRR